MGPLITRLTKLRGMSSAEFAERVRYSLYCAAERTAHRRGRLAPPDRLRNALVGSLRARSDWQTPLLASRQERQDAFFSGTTNRARMQTLFDEAYRGERAAAVWAGDRVLAGEIEFFGQTFRIDRDVAWNRDPVDGAEWPRRYHRDVPGRGWGDVKYVWELNRHQFLIDLGRASFLTGDPRYSARARELVAGWIADNPYATGVNWSCALEPAFRVLSWLWTYYLCADEEQGEPEHHLLWLTSFYDHGRFLHRHLEHYTSPFNHLIGEACALYLLGLLFPEFHEAAAWRRRGRHVLESRLSGQFYADGGSVEQSTFYHHATLVFYLLATVLGRRHGEEFSSDVSGAIERAVAFSSALVQPDGTTPSIGGADDGKPLRMEHRPLWDFRHVQAIGAVLFARRDFKYIAGRFPEDALWLLGPEGLVQFNGVEVQPPEQASVAVPKSGYYVLRSDWSEQADYACVDCGEQAGGLRTDAVPNSVHGHADCLSIVLWLGGQRVLVDSGLFCYNGEPIWESHFRETVAHNTARIDGADQALHLGGMAWSHSYRANPEQWSADPSLRVFVGSHDGYTRRGGDTIHRRLVWLRPGGYVIVYDEFECRREHDVELNFQFAPGQLDVTTTNACFDGNIHLTWSSSQIRLAARHTAGGATPAEGWIAPSLGVRKPAPRLTLSGRAVPPYSATLTVIARHNTAPCFSVSRLPAEGNLNDVVKVTLGELEDYVCAGATASPHQSELYTNGKIAVWTYRSGQQIAAAQVGGSFVRDLVLPPAWLTADGDGE